MFSKYYRTVDDTHCIKTINCTNGKHNKSYKKFRVKNLGSKITAKIVSLAIA